MNTTATTPAGMAHDVFISHSSQDKTVSDAVCAALENAGLRCWIAPRDVQPGRSFAGEITRAIEQSKAMVLVFSANSNNSSQVLREVQLAVSAQLHILQFRIEEVLLNDDLKYYLSTPHWLDAMTPPLENHLQRLSTSIKALLGKATEPSPSAIKPGAERKTGPDPPAAAAAPAQRSFWLRALAVAVVVGAIVVAAILWRHSAEAPPFKASAPPSKASPPSNASAPPPAESPQVSADIQGVVRINFDELAVGFLEPDALVSRGVRSLRTGGGRPAINEAEAGMILTPGHRHVLNVRGNESQTTVIFEFDPPVKKFTLTRIGANPSSLPTWSLQARGLRGQLLNLVSQNRGTPEDPQIREPGSFTVTGDAISTVGVVVDNREGTGTWATYNCLPLIEIEFER